MQPLDDYTQKVIQARRRGLAYPYEIVPLLRGDGGTFIEHDLDAEGHFAPVDRAPGLNRSGVVVGLVRTPTARFPEGMSRVAVLGDPTKAMGSISEPECPASSRPSTSPPHSAYPSNGWPSRPAPRSPWTPGARTSIGLPGSSTALEHTQQGGEVNIVVAGINVGAQPYWNAEATMLMHTRGVLVMTPDSAMVLTGKQAIDYSGGVSAEDNLGIGGYGRIMGPNGEAQYWAPSLPSACRLLLDHYDLTYRAPGERWPRRARRRDATERDVRSSEHQVEGTDFASVGDVFSDATNPDRKKPFDIRALMRAVIDQDTDPLERWLEMADAETAVVYDACLGGLAVS